jgi:hypothetical protein
VERLEPVGRPRLDQRWIGLEQLLHALGATTAAASKTSS